MPRIHPRLFHQARAIDSYLLRLLPVCRDLRSAGLELKWLRENAAIRKQSSVRGRKRLLYSHVSRRSQGEPLQYILGTEYFADLEIKCRPGVLIPRQETAVSASHLVNLLSKIPSRLRVLDLCTGSGCIPLLFHHQFYSHPAHKDITLELAGIDFSHTALDLARENHSTQLQKQSVGCPSLQRRSLESMKFIRADVLRENSPSGPLDRIETPSVLKALQRLNDTRQPKYDILISNPPYISSRDYSRTTSPSVRDFEPKLALVPPQSIDSESIRDGDLFYPHLLRTAGELDVKSALFEVADLDQAKRVAQMAVDQNIWSGIEIWRDNPSGCQKEQVVLHGRNIPILGSGHGRSLLAYRGPGIAWLGKEDSE